MTVKYDGLLSGILEPRTITLTALPLSLPIFILYKSLPELNLWTYWKGLRSSRNFGVLVQKNVSCSCLKKEG